MSNKQYTDSQNKFIEHYEDKNILVSASAGSGKTTSMIARVLNLIVKKNVNIDEMLIVSFTNESANSIKKDLYTALLEYSKTSLEAGIKEQIERMYDADISTLHKFCQRITRQYFYELEIDPEFGIINESDMLELKNRAYDNVLSKIDLTSKNIKNLLGFYLQDKDDDYLRELLFNFHEFLRTRSDYEVYIRDINDKLYDTDLKRNTALKFIDSFLNDVCDAIINKVKNTKNKSVFVGQLPAQERLEEYSIKAKEIKTYVNIIEKYHSLVNIPNTKSLAKSRKEYEEEVVKENFNLFKGEIRQIKSHLKSANFIDKNIKTDQDLKNQLEHVYYQVETLLDVLTRFDDEYSRLKKEITTLDFSDLEQYTYRLLKDKKISSKLQQKYKYVFVDEYQDINDIQDAIIASISNGKNVSMIGDVKQSIYGFRDSDPDIFTNKLDKYNGSTVGDSIFFNENFRSQKPILEFCNEVFSQIMIQETIGFKYAEKSLFKVGASQGKPIKGDIKITILTSEKTNNEVDLKDVYSVKEDGRKKPENNDLSELDFESNYICSEIKNLIGKKIFDSKSGKYKEIEYKDISILVRNAKKNIPVIKDWLRKNKIPVSTKYRIDLFNQFEVGLINSFMHIINNDYDDFNLVNLLSSNIYNLTYNELSKIRLCYPGKGNDNFYIALENYLGKFSEDKISKKINAFYDDIKTFRVQKTALKVSDLIEYIIRKTGLDNYLLALPNGNERIENIKTLINYIRASRYNDDFYRYISYLNTTPDEIEVKISDGKNSVKLSTIHASKGLQYPIVIIPRLAKANSKKFFSGIVWDKDMGIGMDLMDFDKTRYVKSMTNQAIKFQKNLREMYEEIRLLYVAMTRAENKLILIGSKQESDVYKVSKIDGYIDLLVKNKTYLDWILGSDKIYEKFVGNKVKELKFLDINVIKTDTTICNDNISTDKKRHLGMFGEYRDEIYNVLNFKYKHQSSTEIATKTTVTELSSIYNDSEHYSIDKLSKVDTYDKDLDFTYIGNLYHIAMENLKFKKYSSPELKKDLLKLFQDKGLNSDESNAIDHINVDGIKSALITMSEQVKGADMIEKEKRFKIFVPYNLIFKGSKIKDKVMVQGIIDLYYLKNNKLYVVDYKTSRIDSESKIRKKYKTQVEIYKLALEEILNLKVQAAYIYSFHLNKMVNI